MTQIANHTPGPWEYWRDLEKGRHHVDMPGDGAATITGANSIANARLIAAAPELLEGLRAARAVLTCILGTDADSLLIVEQLAQIDAALAKAEAA